MSLSIRKIPTSIDMSNPSEKDLALLRSLMGEPDKRPKRKRRVGPITIDMYEVLAEECRKEGHEVPISREEFTKRRALARVRER